MHQEKEKCSNLPTYLQHLRGNNHTTQCEAKCVKALSTRFSNTVKLYTDDAIVNSTFLARKN